MPAAAILLHARKARGHDLRDQRNALGDVLLRAQNQNQQRNENAAAGDAEEARHEAADATGK
jgi:hypothetical protein